jgi:hypothetical protein
MSAYEPEPWENEQAMLRFLRASDIVAEGNGDVTLAHLMEVIGRAADCVAMVAERLEHWPDELPRALEMLRELEAMLRSNDGRLGVRSVFGEEDGG